MAHKAKCCNNILTTQFRTPCTIKAPLVATKLHAQKTATNTIGEQFEQTREEKLIPSRKKQHLAFLLKFLLKHSFYKLQSYLSINFFYKRSIYTTNQGSLINTSKCDVFSLIFKGYSVAPLQKHLMCISVCNVEYCKHS